MFLCRFQAQSSGTTQLLAKQHTADGSDQVGVAGPFQLRRQIIQAVLNERVADAIEHFDRTDFVDEGFPRLNCAGLGGENAVGRLNNRTLFPFFEACFFRAWRPSSFYLGRR